MQKRSTSKAPAGRAPSPAPKGQGRGSANIIAGAVVALLLLVLFFGKMLGLPSDLRSLLTKQPAPRVKADNWKTMTLAEYGISAEMPGEASLSVRSELLDGKNLSIMTYVSRGAVPYEFSVNIADIREFLRNREFNPVTSMSGFVQGEITGKVLSDRPINLGTVPGREITAESDGGETLRYRVYLQDHYVFYARVRASADLAQSGDAKRFLDSFKFTGPVSDSSAIAAGWMEFAPIDGRFVIQFPGDPSEERETFQTAAGDVVLYKFTVQHGRSNERYSVQYMDYTEKRMKELRTADELLKKAASVDAFNISGTVTSERALPLGMFPGREVHVENAEVAMRIRLYLVDRRLYKISAMWPRGRQISPDDLRFLNSFRTL